MLIPDVLIENLPVRFAAVAMDLQTGEEIVLRLIGFFGIGEGQGFPAAAPVASGSAEDEIVSH